MATWHEHVNADTALAAYQGELGKEIASKGSFEADYAEQCAKYNVVPCPFITSSSQTGTVRVANCAVDLSSWRAMLLVVASVPSLNVENLVVHNVRLGSSHLADLAAATAEKGFKSVKFDYLGHLDEEAKQALRLFLAADVKVEYVSFRGCGLDDAFITANVAALQANFSMKGLNLSYNNITDIGAAALVAALRPNVALREVSLGKNLVTGDGGWIDDLARLLAGSAPSPEDDVACKGVTKALVEFNKKIKDINKKRKKDKMPELAEVPAPPKERILKVEKEMVLANRILSVIDLGQNPLNFEAIRPGLEKLKVACGPSPASTAFGPSALALLLNRAVATGSSGEVPLAEAIIDATLVADLESVGVSLLL